MKDIANHSLKPHNTFGIEAKCSRFLEYTSADEALQVAAILRQAGMPYLIIGGGSNLLLTGDFNGIVVHSALQKMEFQGDHAICGSGVEWDAAISQFLAHGLYGAENLSLIPGDVGAAAVQNIGAYGVEAKDVIFSVTAVDIATGELQVLPCEACRYGYRQSRFKQEWRNRYLIVEVDFLLSREFHPHLDYGNIRSELQQRGINQPQPEELRQVIIDRRQAKLPDWHVTGNAGSFFMNPVVSREKFDALLAQYPQMPHYYTDEQHEKIPAGWLIEQCGWKGKNLGRAGVYERQALILVNRGGATGADIVALCEAIRSDVNLKFGIDIKPEVNIV